jgi:hypothetical protein
VALERGFEKGLLIREVAIHRPAARAQPGCSLNLTDRRLAKAPLGEKSDAGVQEPFASRLTSVIPRCNRTIMIIGGLHWSPGC